MSGDAIRLLIGAKGALPDAPAAADQEPSQHLPPPASGELPAFECVLLAAQTHFAHAALPATGTQVMPSEHAPGSQSR